MTNVTSSSGFRLYIVLTIIYKSFTQNFWKHEMDTARILLIDVAKVLALLGTISIISLALVQFAPGMPRYIGELILRTF